MTEDQHIAIIDRRLRLVDPTKPKEVILDQSEIANLVCPVVILGDPGLGKRILTRAPGSEGRLRLYACVDLDPSRAPRTANALSLTASTKSRRRQNITTVSHLGGQEMGHYASLSIALMILRRDCARSASSGSSPDRVSHSKNRSTELRVLPGSAQSARRHSWIFWTRSAA